MPEDVQSEVMAILKFARDLGLFRKWRHLSDAASFNELERYLQADLGNSYRLEYLRQPWLVFLADDSRVWMRDTEADVFKSNQVYVRTLNEWSKISRGSFLPENITETWKSQGGDEWWNKEGLVTVGFTLEDQYVELQPRYLHDYIDMTLLWKINKLIEHTGYQYRSLASDFGQAAFVMVLTGEEEQQLSAEFSWRFE